MATASVERLYEESIKPLPPEDREALGDLIRQSLREEHEKKVAALIADMHPILEEVLTRRAKEQGRPFDTLAREWAEDLLRPKPEPDLTPEQWEEARQRIRRHFGAVSLGHPSGADNEQIDADLAREYAGGLPERR